MKDVKFHFLGNGWCRNDDVARTNPNDGLINGYSRDSSNPVECREHCLQESFCTGYAISTQAHEFPNRCYIYGNLSKSMSSKWIKFPSSFMTKHFIPMNSSGNSEAKCFRRGIRNYHQSYFTNIYFSKSEKS